MCTRADMLRYAIAYALIGARKLVRGLRAGLTEDERYRVADDVVHRLQQHGDPWGLAEEAQSGKGWSTPGMGSDSSGS
jgi:hypothetical protein